MDMPFDITFKYMDRDESLIRAMNRNSARLNRKYNHVVSCHAYIEKSQKRNLTGGLYTMRLVVNVPPRKAVVIRRVLTVSEVSPGLSALVTDVFDAAEKELESEKGRLRGYNKSPYHRRLKIKEKAARLGRI